MVNLYKLEASLSRNVRDDVREIIYNAVRAKTITSYAKYLGMLVVFGRCKRIFLLYSLKGCGRRLKGGRIIFFLGREKRSSLKRWWKLFLVILWVVTNSQRVVAMRSKPWLPSFCGDLRMVVGKFIGWAGINWNGKKVLVEWDFGAFLISTQVFLGNTPEIIVKQKLVVREGILVRVLFQSLLLVVSMLCRWTQVSFNGVMLPLDVLSKTIIWRLWLLLTGRSQFQSLRV